MTILHEDNIIGRSAELTDQASAHEAQHNANAIAGFRHQAAPQWAKNELGEAEAQVQREDGSWPHPYCTNEDCSLPLPQERMALGRILCVDCQNQKERGRHGIQR